jgi:hypothetical protein
MPSTHSNTQQGDLDDKESLVKALSGAYGVFAVTDFWNHMDDARETQQAKNIFDAAKQHGTKHVVFSSLINVADYTKGKLTHVLHFDSKAKAEDYARQLSLPLTVFRPGFFMANLVGMIRADEGNPKAFTLALPVKDDALFPLFDHKADTGKYVKGAFLHPKQSLGKTYDAAYAWMTPTQILSELKEVKKGIEGAKFVTLTGEQFKGGLAAAGLPPLAQEDFLQNMRLLGEFPKGYFGGNEVGETVAADVLDEKLTSWKEFVGKEKAWKDL